MSSDIEKFLRFQQRIDQANAIVIDRAIELYWEGDGLRAIDLLQDLVKVLKTKHPDDEQPGSVP